MKKILSIILSVVMMLSLASVGTVSAAVAASIGGGGISANIGEKILVPVKLYDCQVLNDLGNGTISGIEINFNYDTTKLKLIGGETELVTKYFDELTQQNQESAWQVDCKTYTDGNFNGKILVDDPKKVGVKATGELEFVILCFEVLSVSGQTPDTESIVTNISFSPVDICDSSAHKLMRDGNGSAAVTGGTIPVTVYLSETNFAVISASDILGYAGQRVVVPLTLYNADAFKGYGSGVISGIEANLSYDYNNLSLIAGETSLKSKYYSPVKNEYLEQSWDIDCKNISNGFGKVMVSDKKLTGVPAVGDIVFADLYFDIPETVLSGTEIIVVVSVVTVCDQNSYKYSPYVKAENFKITVADPSEKAVNDVIAAITGIGEILSSGKADLVSAARNAYNVLTEEEKSAVNNYNILLAAEESINNYKKAEAADALIEAASKIKFLFDKQQVVDARDAYQALTEKQKTLVKTLAPLIAAEKEMERLQNILKGDLEGDGGANVTDVVVLRQRIMSGSFTPDELAAGDLDGDGKFTVSDVVELRRYIINGTAAK